MIDIYIQIIQSWYCFDSVLLFLNRGNRSINSISSSHMSRDLAHKWTAVNNQNETLYPCRIEINKDSTMRLLKRGGLSLRPIFITVRTHK